MSPDEFMRLPVGERLRLISEHRARRWRKSESERRASSARARELVKLIKAAELRWLRERGYGA